MKKLFSAMCIAAVMLLGCVAVMGDEGVTQISARDIVVNRYTDVLGFRGADSDYYCLIDADGNPITEEIYSGMMYVYDLPYFKVETPNSADGIHRYGVIDDQGNTIVPTEYADISVISDRWIAGITLTPSEADDKDYTISDWSTSEKTFYRIDQVDFFYRGEKVGSLPRSDYDGYVTAHGDYISVADRKKARFFYNSRFEKSPVSSDMSSEYDVQYKNGKTFYTHNGTGTAAFTEGCTLTPEEVESAYIYDKGVVYNLQGEEVFKTAQNYDMVRNFQDGYAIVSMNRKYGLIDLEGNEIIPVEYDNVGNYTEHPFKFGYISAVKDGKFGFLDKNAQVTCDFTYSADAVSDQGTFGKIQDLDGSVIVLSAAAGVLPEHYQDVTFPGNSGCMCFVGRNEANEYTLVDLYGNTVIPYSDNSIEVNAAGTVAVVKTDSREYEIHHLDIAAPEQAVSAEPASSAEPAEAGAETWTCENGHEGNTGKFCTECGAKRLDKCPECGYEFDGPAPKFCPECGTALGDI